MTKSDLKTNISINSTEETGLGTAVEIALGVALCTVCAFLIVVLVYIKKKKQTTDDLSVLAMTAVDSKSVQPEFATRTRMGPGSVAQSTRGSIANDDYKYERIIEILKECDPEDWESYLGAFKNEKLTDDTLKLIPCDAKDDSEAMWKELLPQLGIRLAFKKQWSEEVKHDGMATPGGGQTPGRGQSPGRDTDMPGTTIKYEGQGLDVEEAGNGQVAHQDTREIDLAEPEAEAECEGNETKFDDGPALPQNNGIAMAAEPDDVIALQEEAPKAAFGAPASYQYNQDNMKMMDDDSDEDNMYKPGLARKQTRGGPGGFQE